MDFSTAQPLRFPDIFLEWVAPTKFPAPPQGSGIRPNMAIKRHVLN
jgi:hypothetical protein